MEKKKEKMYRISFEPYEIVKKNKDAKKIFIDDNFIALSVGSTLSFGDELKSTLHILVYYDNKKYKEFTKQIPNLENFGTTIAINPNFKDDKLIAKLKELDIISDTLETVEYKNKNYDLVKVNIEELMQYKPFGDAILKDYLSIEKDRQEVKEKELE